MKLGEDNEDSSRKRSQQEADLVSKQGQRTLEESFALINQLAQEADAFHREISGKQGISGEETPLQIGLRIFLFLIKLAIKGVVLAALSVVFVFCIGFFIVALAWGSYSRHADWDDDWW